MRHRCSVTWLVFPLLVLASRPAPGVETVTHPYQGITYITRIETSPRAEVMHIVEVDLTAPGVRFQMTPAGGARDTVRQTTLDYLNQSRAEVAINAHFFVPFPTSDATANVVGLAASNGNVYSGFEPQPVAAGFVDQSYAIVPYAPALNIDAANHAGIVHLDPGIADGKHVLEPVSLYSALSGSAQIVTSGVNSVPVYRDATHPDGLLTPNGTYSNSYSWYSLANARTVIGLTRDNETLVMFTVDKAGASLGMTPGEIANMLIADYGVYNALNLDGGGSTTMAMRDPITGLGSIVNVSADNPLGRSVGSNLAVFANPVPEPATIALLAAGILGLIATRKSREVLKGTRAVAGFLLAGAAALALPAPLQATSVTTHPFTGITRIDRTETSPRTEKMHIIEVDLTAPGISFAVTHQGGTRDTVRQTTLDFLKQEQAQVAVNAHFFVPFPSSDLNSGLVGLAASAGNVYSPFEPEPVGAGFPDQSYAILPYAPGLNIDASNHAAVVHRDAAYADNKHVLEPMTLFNAVSGCAQIVTDGKITVPTYNGAANGGLNPLNGYSDSNSWYNLVKSQTMIGLSQDQETLVIFTVDVAGGSQGMTAPEVAALLINDYGVDDAIELDNGGSTTLAMEDPATGVRSIVNYVSDQYPTGRIVGSSLAVFAQPIPEPATAALLAGGVLTLLASRKRKAS